MKVPTECPHCGGEYGYYRKMYMFGYGSINYEFNNDCHRDSHGFHDGIDNGMMHDGLKYRENKTAFCIECQKPIKELKKD